jgi:kinesin family protein 5
MMGTSDDPGLIPRLLHEIFDHSDKQKHVRANINASFFEVYFERVFDLLSDWRSAIPPSKLEATLLGSGGLSLMQGVSGDLLVSGAVSVPVKSVNEVLELFERGRKVRMTGSTMSNHYSSRSHAIFLLTGDVYNRETAMSYVSQLYLCDLAGSERVSKTETSGIRLQEASKINLSILTLGKVISALTEQSAGGNNSSSGGDPTNAASGSPAPARTHIPYRDSKLTRFLTNALGGNGICVMLMCVSPDFLDSCETDATLQLGARSQCIQNTIVVNAR